MIEGEKRNATPLPPVTWAQFAIAQAHSEEEAEARSREPAARAGGVG